jgi:LuxR family maltose regulon positive regulatory protein
MALLVLGEAQNLQGDTTSAVETLHEVLRLGRKHNDYFMIIGALTNLAQQLNWQGKRREAEALCHEAVKLSFDDSGHKRPMAGFSYITLAEMELHAGDLDSTFQHLMHGLEMSKKFAMAGFEISGKLVLGPLQHAMGQSEAALKTLHEIVQVVFDGTFTAYTDVSLALEADMRLKCDDIAGASAWAEKMTLPHPNSLPLTLMKEMEYLAYARYLLATNQADTALQLLDMLEESAAGCGRGLMVLSVRLVRARALAAQNRIEPAQAQLALAVKQAAPENYRLVFWQDGPAIAQMLPAVRHLAPDFVDSIIAAASDRYRLELMQPAPPATGATSPAPISTAVNPDDVEPLIEPLTEREIEVLQLIAEGQSNKEAAENLVVTVGTVKKHLSNIFGKLGVSSRTQAIARARELRVL